MIQAPDTIDACIARCVELFNGDKYKILQYLEELGKVYLTAFGSEKVERLLVDQMMRNQEEVLELLHVVATQLELFNIGVESLNHRRIRFLSHLNIQSIPMAIKTTYNIQRLGQDSKDSYVLGFFQLIYFVRLHINVFLRHLGVKPGLIVSGKVLEEEKPKRTRTTRKKGLDNGLVAEVKE